MPAAFSTPSASAICRARMQPPAPVGQLRRRAASPDSALSALFRLSISLPHSTPVISGCSATAAPFTFNAARSPGTPAPISIVPLVARWKRAGSPLAMRLHDIEGHHAGHDATHAAETRQQQIDIADAVLEADDRHARGRVLGDQPCHGCGGAALDGDQNDVGLGEGGRRIGRQLDRRGRQHPVRSIEIGDAQALALQ